MQAPPSWRKQLSSSVFEPSSALLHSGCASQHYPSFASLNMAQTPSWNLKQLMVDVLAYLVFLGELDALVTLAVLKRSGFCNGVLISPFHILWISRCI